MKNSFNKVISKQREMREKDNDKKIIKNDSKLLKSFKCIKFNV